MCDANSHVVGHAACTVYVNVILPRSKVKVKVTEHLNFRKLAKPCMLTAMTVSPLAYGGSLVSSENKNSSGDEIANVNGYAVRPGSHRNSLK